MPPNDVVASCWAAVGGDRAALGALEITAPDAWLGGPLAVDDLAVGATACALLAAADLAQARGGRRPFIELSAEHVALSFRSEHRVLVNGNAAGAGFAALSRFVRCRDGGWVRTHGNYPHHGAALGRALAIDVSRQTAAGELQTRAAAWDAVALEEAVIEAGGCAAAVRSPERWAQHPAGRAAGGSPLVAFEDRLAGEASRGLRPAEDGVRRMPLVGQAGPAAGLRVLDLTRVIAGPVAGRTLAALGAEVLRIDPATLPELPVQHLDTGAGKRSAFVDLADAGPREALLAGADVILTGYRPGSLARFALGADELAERHPHLMQVSLSAWGTVGPWAGRRGFDSLVQAASGIAVRCAAADGTPGALPAQALDHATGQLMAATALRGLVQRARGEVIAPARLSLARTAAELLDAPAPEHQATDATGRADPECHRAVFGEVSLVAPPGSLDGVTLRWAHGPRPLGGDAPVWS